MRTSTFIVSELPRRSNSPVFDHLEQFGLQFQRQFADLIQKQGRAVGNSKRPNRLECAPVKAPFSWPKSSLSIRFEGSAAQFILTRARSLRRLKCRESLACHQLLAGSGFSENQDICIRAGDLFNLVKHVIDGITFADDVLMVVFQFDFFLKIGSLGFELVFEFFLISARSLLSSAAFLASFGRSLNNSSRCLL
jgi:hypothetical protein